MPTREAVFEALFTHLQTVPGIRLFSRRVKMWSDIPSDNQPALILTDHNELRMQQPPQGLPSKLMLRATILLYVNTGDENAVPGIALNNLLDSIDAAFAPDDKYRNVFTLNKLVYRCWIEGDIIKDPGDLDGQGIAIIPVHILMP